MSERKGHISVNTQDIFPIIKKWLYSEHDIFVRELISNANDAITKRQTMDRADGQKVEPGKIHVALDSDAGTITIKDNGLGMTEEEVEKYIAQLAFSGAQEFVDKMKESGNETQDIIGKFGLGFFSAFMVADTVTVHSLSRSKDAKPAKWVSNGDTEYTFVQADKSDVGTEIVLKINAESKDFLTSWKLRETIKRYCDFMPNPIELVDLKENKRIEEENAKAEKEEDKKPLSIDIVNETGPLWKKDPSSLKDEDYKNFYRKLYPMDPEPLFWIHLNVDHPFTLQGILYFPKLDKTKPVNDSNIKLYSKQVFVSDNVKNVIPDFLALLKGAIDSSDIPLNVSRSALQGDPNIKKISKYIIKKVAESLKKLYKNERERYEKAWEDIGLFIKYGAVSDTKFDDLMRDKILFGTKESKYLTLDEYSESIPETYKEKMKDKIVYFEEGKSDESLREQFESAGIPVLNMDNYIDPHFMQHAEVHKKNDKEYKFLLVDNALEEVFEAENVSDEDLKVKDIFSEILIGKSDKESDKDSEKAGASKGNLEIEVKNFTSSQNAAYMKVDQSMKRFQQMSQQMGQGNFDIPMKKTLVLNPKSSLVQSVFKLWNKSENTDSNKELAKKLVHHIQDLAQISGEGLGDKERANFVTRSQGLVDELTQIALK